MPPRSRSSTRACRKSDRASLRCPRALCYGPTRAMSASPHGGSPSRLRRFLAGACGEWMWWAGAWIAARFALVAAFADVFGYGEEAERACTAKAMLDGLGVPHYQLSYRYFEGGAFAFSHLEALAFLALGPTWLAAKLVALLFGAAILLAGWKLCDELGGRAAA